MENEQFAKQNGVFSKYRAGNKKMYDQFINHIINHLIVNLS